MEVTNIGDDALALGFGFADRYHGHQGYLDLMRLWRAAWLSPRYTPEAVTDLGDRFVVRIKLTGQGASSGAEVAQSCGCVLDFADGAVVRMAIYWDWSEYVEALGCSAARRPQPRRAPEAAARPSLRFARYASVSAPTGHSLGTSGVSES